MNSFAIWPAAGRPSDEMPHINLKHIAISKPVVQLLCWFPESSATERRDIDEIRLGDVRNDVVRASTGNAIIHGG